ncbi:unnamed protein product [Bursaphelenchus xylophilus]|uniref:(pine wood nematode) hypothetical protein n=1 Tax=Bursaphelenchus xylophilus TaxID=6326 RepID=A0A1I7RIB8_BURXY|nr:unnamed protein product [Bursaphelenchus xylophilus]CAG9115010.1 unnamed protein product [Bursaphelenchus xylophilus]
MDVYRVLLYYNLYADIALTVLSFFCKPIVIIYNANFYIIGETPFKIADPVGQFAIFMIYVYSYYQTFIVCPLSYYFRYLAVCRAKVVTNLKFVALAVFWTFIGSGSMLIFCYVVLYPTDERLEEFYFMRSEFNSTILRDGKNILAGLTSSNDSALHKTLYMWNGFTIVTMCYVATFYFMHQVTSSFRVRNKGTKWHDINKQIARVMLVQASVPMLLLAPSYFLMFHMYMFGMESDAKQYFVNILMTLAPLVNPYIGILMVKSYRKTVCFCSSSYQEREVYPEEQTAEEAVI